MLDNDDPNKRGWKDEDDIRNCVRTMEAIVDIRLNVNHEHKDNSKNHKYLYPQPGLTIKGWKQNV